MDIRRPERPRIMPNQTSNVKITSEFDPMAAISDLALVP
jgi:hypothetical protein